MPAIFSFSLSSSHTYELYILNYLLSNGSLLVRKVAFYVIVALVS